MGFPGPWQLTGLIESSVESVMGGVGVGVAVGVEVGFGRALLRCRRALALGVGVGVALRVLETVFRLCECVLAGEVGVTSGLTLV